MAAFERIMHIGECIYCHEFEVIVFSDVTGDKQHYYGKFNDGDEVNCSRCLATGVIQSNGDEQCVEWNAYPDDSIKSWPRLKREVKQNVEATANNKGEDMSDNFNVMAITILSFIFGGITFIAIAYFGKYFL